MKEVLIVNLPLSLKRKLVHLRVYVLPWRTWSLTEVQKSELKVCQTSAERSILGVNKVDRTQNTMLRSKTHVTIVGKTVKMRLAGHICPRHPEKWVCSTTQWVLQDCRWRRSKLRCRWQDDLDDFSRDWPVIAVDKESWKSEGPLPPSSLVQQLLQAN